MHQERISYFNKDGLISNSWAQLVETPGSPSLFKKVKPRSYSDQLQTPNLSSPDKVEEIEKLDNWTRRIKPRERSKHAATVPRTPSMTFRLPLRSSKIYHRDEKVGVLGEGIIVLLYRITDLWRSI